MGSCATEAIELAEVMFDSAGPGIAIASFSQGVLLDPYCRGVANLETGQLINSDTALHVASVSKQFTAYAIAQLICSQQVNLSDRVVRYLPFLPKTFAEVTIEQLLDHTSGLSDQWALLRLAGWTDENTITTPDINKVVSRANELKHAPGKRFSYTNTGYTFLAEVIEKITGQTLDAYLQSVLFEPLGMSHARFYSGRSAVLSHEAECYSRALNATYSKTTPHFETVGATSLRLSLRDVALWADYLMSSNRPSVKLMQRMGRLLDGTFPSYGFGLYHGVLGGQRVLSHSGWDRDFSAHVIYMPASKTGAAVFSNGTQMNLELMAAAFLEQDRMQDGFSRGVLERLSTLKRSLSISAGNAPRVRVSSAYGSLDSGDVRLFQGDSHGGWLRGGALQRLQLLPAGDYMPGASLSHLEVRPDRLLIASSAQGESRDLRILPIGQARETIRGVRAYRSESLRVTHSVSEQDGSMVWSGPCGESFLLTKIDAETFFANGFTLHVSEEALIIHNARTAPLRCDRIRDGACDES